MAWFRMMFLLAIVAFFMLWVRTEVNRSGRAIGQLQNEVGIKKARNQYLKLEISRLSGPEEVTRLAEEKFGFKPLGPQQVIVLDK